MKREFLDSIDTWNGRDVLSVLGPTGSGKTSAVLDLVRERFKGDLQFPLIVSVDAVAVYRGLDIGSAKPTSAERAVFRWAGIDIADPSRQVSVADYLNAVLPEIEKSVTQQKPVILVGGSHFYERALAEGLSPGGPSDPAFQAMLDPQSSEVLHAKLLSFDARWSKIHVNDRYRITRYLDLVMRQGFDFDALNTQNPARSWSVTATCIRGLSETPDEIRSRMKDRIRTMFQMGWVQEVRGLLSAYSKEARALQSVGYREIVDSFEKPISEGELSDDILTAHMQLAKKQRTWLRGLKNKGA